MRSKDACALAWRSLLDARQAIEAEAVALNNMRRGYEGGSGTWADVAAYLDCRRDVSVYLSIATYAAGQMRGQRAAAQRLDVLSRIQKLREAEA